MVVRLSTPDCRIHCHQEDNPTPKKIRALVQTGPQQLEVREFPIPKIGPDEGLLRVEQCGVCGSDVEQLDGAFSFVKYPLIPGHEPLGVIEEIGERAAARWGVQVGDRVAPESFVPCNHCRYCLSGQYTLCNNGRSHGYTPIEIEPSVWGGFSDYMYLHPNTIVHRVPKDISPEVAVMYNPLGAGVRWACQVPRTQLGETVVVLGPGQRGLACVIAAKAGGAGLIII